MLFGIYSWVFFFFFNFKFSTFPTVFLLTCVNFEPAVIATDLTYKNPVPLVHHEHDLKLSTFGATWSKWSWIIMIQDLKPPKERILSEYKHSVQLWVPDYPSLKLWFCIIHQMLENSPQGNRNCQENKTSCDEPSLHMGLSAIFVQFPDSKGKCNAQNHKINRDHNRSQPAPKISAVKVTAGTTHVPRHCLSFLFPRIVRTGFPEWKNRTSP